MITQLRQRLEQEKGRLQQVKDDRNATAISLAELANRKLIIEAVQLIFQTVAQQTQDNLSWYINDMVTAAMEAVFPDEGYQFKLEFVQRRGKTEADLYLADAAGNKVKPSDAEGGGLVNVVAFALRVALWSLSKPSRPVFVLDEPFSFLHSTTAHERVAELLKTLSEKLGLQIIMVTGEESEEIISQANRIISVKKIKGISNVTIR